MVSDKFDNAFHAYKHRRPYHPFTITMVDGTQYEIDHEEAISIREGAAVFLAPGSVPVFFDHEGVSHIFGDLTPSPSNG